MPRPDETVTLPFEPLLRRIGEAADALGVEAYAVGGAVRDALLGRETTDIDIVAVDPAGAPRVGIRLAEAVAKASGAKPPNVYPAFGTAAVTLYDAVDDAAGEAERQRLVVEFVGARKESYRRESRKPIVEDGTLADDLARRDFTVNALAVRLNNEDVGSGQSPAADLTSGAGGDAPHPASLVPPPPPNAFGQIVDLYGGLDDLSAGLLRTPLDPQVTFEDDPLRMLRAARFAAQLGFRVAPEALEAMREAAGRIEIVSQERITDELGKTLAAPLPSLGFVILHETGLLERVLPEISALAGTEAVGGHTHKDNLYHTLEVVDNLALLQAEEGLTGLRAGGFALWLRWAALFHDVAKPDTKRFTHRTGWTFHGHEDLGARKHVPASFRRLKLPLGEPLAYVRKMVALHHRPIALVDENVTDSAVRRLLFDAGEDVDDLMLLVRADVTSKNEKRRRRYLRGFDRVEAKMIEVEEKDKMRAWEPPVSGEEIMERLELPEGVAVGILKERLREAVLDGEVPNEHDAAWAWVERQRPDAVRRGDLFMQMVRLVSGPEKRALGAIKEAVFWDDLPLAEADALAHLQRIKDKALEA
ncbi:CCA tRNA nucleotidyltransferase [Rubricoccus marinus]|uniref:tRNA nucleotidyltransferase n=1 Tax=Rubricoccus marinus TaxID=716817 RepID=A0A259U2R3_9BACT|nr:CCA tRNA nucleotidyltransferase [Rubricoccus marinus]OZC04128.1 tRNA nucleotidyltransferase [Rubricoccus marinus]